MFLPLDDGCLWLKSAELEETTPRIVPRAKKKIVSQDDLLDMKVAGNF